MKARTVMQITSANTIAIELVQPTIVAPSSGPLARKIRQAKRELAQLLEVTRDSPTMRLNIAEARAVLAELEAQIPGVLRPEVIVVAHSIDIIQLAPSRLKQAPALPPRPKAPAVLWPARLRNSPLQKMREAQNLETIAEETLASV